MSLDGRLYFFFFDIGLLQHAFQGGRRLIPPRVSSWQYPLKKLIECLYLLLASSNYWRQCQFCLLIDLSTIDTILCYIQGAYQER